MGQDARWVCHTCKTVCARGGRLIFQHVVDSYTTGSVDYFKEMLRKFHSNFEFDDYERYISFLNDLRKWLERHETHSVHIGSNYSTDMMDLEEYHNETIDGVVDKLTRIEAESQAIGIVERDSIDKIKKAIFNNVSSVVFKRDHNMDTVAKELYNKFSIREI